MVRVIAKNKSMSLSLSLLAIVKQAERRKGKGRAGGREREALSIGSAKTRLMTESLASLREQNRGGGGESNLLHGGRQAPSNFLQMANEINGRKGVETRGGRTAREGKRGGQKGGGIKKFSD